MDWMNWKTWTVAAVILIAGFAIYVFAAPEGPRTPAPARPTGLDVETLGMQTTTARGGSPRRGNGTARAADTAIVEPVHLEWLDAQSGSYSSNRNLFIYKEPPPPPPPPPPQPPPPPPDKDKDGVPDFRDNCVNTANPDQSDIDRDGIGTACETEAEIAPPPPPPPAPVPPQFTYRFIGTFGNPANPIATFARDGDIVNARVGDVIEGKFILRGIGIESVEIGFTGFPADQRQRIPLSQ